MTGHHATPGTPLPDRSDRADLVGGDLVAIRDAAQHRLEKAISRSRAVGEHARFVLGDLTQRQEAAVRRVDLAHRTLARARRGGSPQLLSRAEQLLWDAETTSGRVGDEVITGSRRAFWALDEVFAAMQLAWDAGAAVIDALGHPQPGHDVGRAGPRHGVGVGSSEPAPPGRFRADQVPSPPEPDPVAVDHRGGGGVDSPGGHPDRPVVDERRAGDHRPPWAAAGRARAGGTDRCPPCRRAGG